MLLIISCAPKICPKPKEILNRVFQKPPEKAKLYGYVKTPILRIPFVFEKNGYDEKIKTPGDVVIFDTSLLCFQGVCFELPELPSNFIYGYFPGDYRIKECNQTVTLVSRDGKEIILEGKRLKAVKYKNLEIIYGEKSKEGYYREISVKLGGQEIKILIEGII